MTLTAVYKGDTPAIVVYWQGRTSSTDKWEYLKIDNLKLTISAILYETKDKTSTSTLLVSRVENDDEKQYRAQAYYSTGERDYWVNSTAVDIIIKCKSVRALLSSKTVVSYQGKTSYCKISSITANNFIAFFFSLSSRAACYHE